MIGGEYSGLVISDFNVDAFTRFLANDPELPVFHTTAAPFGQVTQVLLNDDSECWKTKHDFAIIWTQPGSVSRSFNLLLYYQQVSLESVLGEVDDFVSSLMNIRNKVDFLFVPMWVVPPFHRGFGMLDMKPGFGMTNVLMQMNLRLAELLNDQPNTYVLNTEKWVANSGKYSFNPKLWYMAKIPFGNDILQQAVKDIKSAVRGLTGHSKKLIVLDLDDTLWGGIVGEVGWEHLTLGGHDIVGEAYVDFQNALKSLVNRGILLTIVSKNDESVALEAIKNHPEMILTLEDFVGWRINWNDKAQNIVDLASDLNLDTESIVFIDDNPVEGARVKEALPEVFVPEWPDDKMLYKKALLSLSCFDAPSITTEDLARTQMYKIEQQRRSMKKEVSSVEAWLKTLGTRVKIEELNDVNISRTAQLLNKTNQLNLSTRRLNESELMVWARQGHHKLWTLRVSDKFGDMGLTGIVSLEVDANEGRIIDFVLSCRVMGRKIEQTMVYAVINYAKSIQLREIWAKYIPTPKNNPCLEYWKTSGFSYNKTDNTFHWEVGRNYSPPDPVQIEWENSLGLDYVPPELA
jgi:FkbH-like protein